MKVTGLLFFLYFSCSQFGGVLRELAKPCGCLDRADCDSVSGGAAHEIDCCNMLLGAMCQQGLSLGAVSAC
jgi:hypothetical protein